MTTRAKTDAGVLRAAARYIREVGWYQGGGRDPKSDAVCAWAAICDVVGWDGRQTTAYDEFSARVHGHGISWNDEPGRTVDEVLAVLEGKA